MPLLETLSVIAALAASLSLRPWRMLRGARLLGPALAFLVLLPWVWALPWLHPMPLRLQWSGACLVVLMLGWPLAVPVLVAVALIAGVLGGVGLTDAAGLSKIVALAAWQGILPATLALGLGALMRRFLPDNLFLYVLGRAFIGTGLCMFAAELLAFLNGKVLPNIDPELSLVALWLESWSDAVVTGMLAAVFVAFRPEWLATFSDQRYLRQSRSE